MITKIVSAGRSFDLDHSSQRLFRERDEPVPLSAKQWKLLCHFVQNAGKLLTKDDLIQAVWDGNTVTDEAVAQTVRALRKAFDDDRRDPVFFEVEYGRGYRFIAEVAKVGAAVTDEVEVEDKATLPPSVRGEAELLHDALLNASADPHDSNYIAPTLVKVKRFCNKTKVSRQFKTSLNVLIDDIDQMRKGLTYPAPAHLSVHDLDYLVGELERISTGLGVQEAVDLAREADEPVNRARQELAAFKAKFAAATIENAFDLLLEGEDIITHVAGEERYKSYHHSFAALLLAKAQFMEAEKAGDSERATGRMTVAVGMLESIKKRIAGLELR